MLWVPLAPEFNLTAAIECKVGLSVVAVCISHALLSHATFLDVNQILSDFYNLYQEQTVILCISRQYGAECKGTDK